VRQLTRCLIASLLSLAHVPAALAAPTDLMIAPSPLTAAASRIRAVDLERLGNDLARAGLEPPPRIDVTLIPETDPRAADVPRWIVGLALEPADIVIFPERVLPYPYDSIQSVFRHEVAHLALAARAGGRDLPRWFHEGLAVAVDAGWGVGGRLRLLLEMTGNPVTADLARLFASNNEPETAQAYGLSAALVADLQRRHGAAAPGAIAARVAQGISFARAFQLETGETPDEAATRAWTTYRHWTMWVSVGTSQTTVWGAILVLACLAFIARARRRERRRRQWDEEEARDIEID